MAVETRHVETPESSGADATPRASRFERALGVLVMVGGAAAVALAVPVALRYPMALAVAVAITAVGAGVAWSKPWAWSGLLCLGSLLCSGSIGYLLIQGRSLLTFSWFFVPGAYFVWVALRAIHEGRRVAAAHV
jgi:hypothetical protein